MKLKALKTDLKAGITAGKLYPILSASGTFYFYLDDFGQNAHGTLQDGHFEIVDESFIYDPTYIKRILGDFNPEVILGCSHTFKTYYGLRESFDFCVKCDKKRDLC